MATRIVWQEKPEYLNGDIMWVGLVVDESGRALFLIHMTDSGGDFTEYLAQLGV